jgi:hypothetical protein
MLPDSRIPMLQSDVVCQVSPPQVGHVDGSAAAGTQQRERQGQDRETQTPTGAFDANGGMIHHF